ncbi:hypothetical protein D3C84_825280 [compost metagenome]
MPRILVGQIDDSLVQGCVLLHQIIEAVDAFLQAKLMVLGRQVDGRLDGKAGIFDEPLHGLAGWRGVDRGAVIEA